LRLDNHKGYDSVMTVATVNTGEPMSIQSIGRQFYQDVAHLLMRPGSFYAALPTGKNQADKLIFLGLTALVYSVMVGFFTAAPRPMIMVLYAMNALLMPVVTALVLHLLLRVVYPGRYTYGLLLGVTAYANVVLLLAWIPGLAPWAELLKYGLIGLGLVKTGGISGLKAFLAVAATGVVLVMMVYWLQYVMRF